MDEGCVTERDGDHQDRDRVDRRQREMGLRDRSECFD